MLTGGVCCRLLIENVENKLISNKLQVMSVKEEELLRTLKDIIEIVNESEGVAGYHLKGEVAEWAWFDCIVRADALIEARDGEKQPDTESKCNKHVVSKPKGTVCPDCGDYGWIYDETGTVRSTCPCHY